MSETHMRVAVEAGAEGIAERLRWASMHWGTQDMDADAHSPLAKAAIEAALPHLRQMIAEEIQGHEAALAAVQSESPRADDWHYRGVRYGLREAAKIALGEQP